MESLDNYMQRSSTTRRILQNGREQRTPAERTPSQPPQAERRPSPEARPPLGPRNAAYSSQPPSTSAPRTQGHNRRYANNTSHSEQQVNPTHPYRQERPSSYETHTPRRSPLSPQNLANYGASTYQHYEVQEDEQDIPQSYRVSSQMIYHHTDDAIPTIEADVMEENIPEAEEEDMDQEQYAHSDSLDAPHYGQADNYFSHNNRSPVSDAVSGHHPPYDVASYPAGGRSFHRNREAQDLRNIRPGELSTRHTPAPDHSYPQAHNLPAPMTTPIPQRHSSEQVRPEQQRPPRSTQPLASSQNSTAMTPARPAPLPRPFHEKLSRPVLHRPATPTPSRISNGGTFVSPIAKPPCQICHGAGYLRADVPFGHPNFGKPIACSCKEAERKAKRRMQLREMSNMDAFQDCSFQTFNSRTAGVREAYEAAVRYASEPFGWLIFLGPNGCGKTHLAAAIANKCLEDGSVVLFSVVPDLLDHLRAAFAPTATEMYDQLFSKMRDAQVLILDDLGAQQSSPWANEKLFQLLNYRYNLELPTVITANSKGLQGLDERIRSRMNDVAISQTVNFTYARDYRPHHGRHERD